MGSGETAPTMVKVHRLVVDRIRGETPEATQAPGRGRGPGADASAATGILLDTPFGFQTNASEIAARAVSYFEESVGATLEVAGLRSASDLEGDHGHEIVARIAELPLVFAGPGSPSYALRQWKGTVVPSLLSEKLNLGGAVTFASAAALTLGISTVPVYEVYKVGEDPHWLEGLDLLEPLGMPAVVIPHYDNAEGQTHDTRYCYLGEARLSQMEQQLAEGTFVLGVDEHTALCIDLACEEATVLGRGGATVRVRGRSARIEAGESVPVGRILEIAVELTSTSPRAAIGTSSKKTGESTQEPPGVSSSGARAAGEQVLGDEPAAAVGDSAFRPASAGSPLLEGIRAHESTFRSARERSDVPGMVGAVLALEEEMWAWRADTLQSDEMDRGRASLRSMIKDLGQLSAIGARDPAELIAPYVDMALALRDSARLERRFAEADSVRERLELLGVAIQDTAEGTTWELTRDARVVD